MKIAINFVLASALLLVLIIVSAITATQPLGEVSKWVRARSWTPVEATVTDLKVVNRPTRKMRFIQQLEVNYTYEFQGQKYVSSQIGLTPHEARISRGLESAHSTFKKSYATHTKVPVWVNPDTPNEAVLIREIQWPLYGISLGFLPLISLIAICVLSGLHEMLKIHLVSMQGNKQVLKEKNIAGWHVAAAIASFAFMPVCWGLMFGMQDYVMPAGWQAALVTCPALPGIVLLWKAIKLRMLRQKIGHVVVRIDQQMPSLGGVLSGVVELDRASNPDKYLLRLVCQRNMQFRQSWRSDRIWDRQLQLTANTRAPFNFEIPQSTHKSDAAVGTVYFTWQLELTKPEQKQPLVFPVYVYPKRS